VKRTMHSDFFWGLVSQPNDIGSDLDKKKEEGRVRPDEEEMFNVICCNEDEKNDYQEFEVDVAGDDDENISIVSSCVDSCSSGEAFEPEEDWESLNETGRKSKISEALKKLGNVQKRNMNSNITKDFYEVAGKIAMKDVKRNHEKLVRKEILQINSIFRAVRYFKSKMRIRRRRLQNCIDQSVAKTYKKVEYWWRDEIEMLMEEERASSLVER
jgi:hypothetical protein